jgi:hypothetical protein
LEALDSEVVKLQSLLALVGKHIKAGAQQHQVGWYETEGVTDSPDTWALQIQWQR